MRSTACRPIVDLKTSIPPGHCAASGVRSAAATDASTTSRPGCPWTWTARSVSTPRAPPRSGELVGHGADDVRASRSAMRRSWKRRLERAALRRSSRVRLSAVSWRTRCLRVVFSVVTRWIASWVHSASRSRIRPSSSPMRVRWARISVLAVLSASSALSARSRQVALLARPARLGSVALVGGLPDCLGDSGFGIRVGVEEGPGHVGAASDGGDGDRGLVPAESRDGLVDAAERGLGVAVAGRPALRRCGARIGRWWWSCAGLLSSWCVAPFALSLCCRRVGEVGGAEGGGPDAVEVVLGFAQVQGEGLVE